MPKDYTNALEGARDGAKVQKVSTRATPRRTNPAATPGDDASQGQKTSPIEHHPEFPAATPGADAIVEMQPSTTPHQRTNPALAGETDQQRLESHIPLVGLHNTTGQSAMVDQTIRADEGDGPTPDSGPVCLSPSPTKSRRKAGETDRSTIDAQRVGVGLRNSGSNAGQVGGDHKDRDAQDAVEIPDLRWSDPIVAEIVQLHRMRRRWIKAKNALILQGKAFGRAVCAGDKVAGTAAYDRVMAGKAAPDDSALEIALMPFGAAIAHFETSLGPIEKRLEKLAKQLPIAPFVESTHGLGYGSVAAIVGEAGDLSKYPSVAGVWKRMGLAVIDGDGRQRRVADAERALIHGYNPERRSVMWNAGNGIIGGMGNGKRPPAGADLADMGWTEYQTLFVERLRYEADREPAMRLTDTKEGKESYTKHAAARAKRYVEKRLLRDLTAAWRQAVGHIASVTQSCSADRQPLPNEVHE